MKTKELFFKKILKEVERLNSINAEFCTVESAEERKAQFDDAIKNKDFEFATVLEYGISVDCVYNMLHNPLKTDLIKWLLVAMDTDNAKFKRVMNVID